MTNIAYERKMFAQQGLPIYTRENWGAVQSYTSDRTVYTPVEGFFLHISVTIDHGDLTGDEHTDMRTIERIGQERFGIGFPYNAAIFDTGRLYEGQPLTRRGAHTVNDENQPGFRETGSHGSLNYWYRAIVLPQMVTDDVTDAQVHMIAKWAAAQIRAGYAKRLATWNGHRDVSAKSCPGDAGYARLPDIRRLTEYYVTHGLNPVEQPNRKDPDMAVIVAAKDRGPFFISGNEGTGITHDDRRAFQASGIPYSVITQPTYDNMRVVYKVEQNTSPALVDAIAADTEAIRADLADEEPS